MLKAERLPSGSAMTRLKFPSPGTMAAAKSLTSFPALRTTALQSTTKRKIRRISLSHRVNIRCLFGFPKRITSRARRPSPLTSGSGNACSDCRRSTIPMSTTATSSTMAWGKRLRSLTPGQTMRPISPLPMKAERLWVGTRSSLRSTPMTTALTKPYGTARL